MFQSSEQFHSERQSQLFAEYLAVTSIACPSCRHDLRSSSGTRCPECGVGLRFRIEVAKASESTWWWIGLFGASFAGVLSGWLLLGPLEKVSALLVDPKLPLVVRGGFAPNSALPNWSAVSVMLLCSLISWICVAMLLARRKWFAQIRLPFRIVAGLLLMLLPIIVLGVVRWYLSTSA